MKKLNLGCGKDKRKGYINIDIRKKHNPDILCNAKKLPFQDNEIDEILASDILEHFGRHKTLSVLKEWNRVLKPGGKLIIKCPDLKKIASAYSQEAIDGIECARLLYGNQEDNDPVNFHKNGFDYFTIQFFLKESGFKIEKITGFPITSGDWKNMLVEAVKWK